MKLTFRVTGMNCASCSARVQNAVSALPGVTGASVNLLTGTMITQGQATEREIIAAVTKAGYGAFVVEDSAQSYGFLKNDEHSQIRSLCIRLAFSAVGLLSVLYIGVGYSMLGLPLPGIFGQSGVVRGWIQAVVCLMVLALNYRFFYNGAKGVRHLAPNMDTLVSLGAGISFVYSLFVLCQTTVVNGITAESLQNQSYFESSAMIVTFVSIGKLLEARAKGKTTDALRNLTKLAPVTAHIVKNGVTSDIRAQDVCVDDIFTVFPGESIPVDGVVTKGDTTVDESSVTGESIPADKCPGQPVIGATVNLSGFITCRATRVGKDTTLNQMIKIVADATAGKAPIAALADKVARVFVPVVLMLAVITAVCQGIATRDLSFALARAVCVLVISCPCALGLATPVAIMVASGVGAENGILFKTAQSLELLGKTRVIAFDKTGTLTKGTPDVTDVLGLNGCNEHQLLQLAASAEQHSEHPLAKALVAYVQTQKIELYECDGFVSLPGSGVKARVKNSTVTCASFDYTARLCDLPLSVKEQYESFAEQGKTPILITENDRLLGIIAFADTLKTDSAKAVSAFRRMGYKTVMLTGDNTKTARAMADKLTLDEVFAQILPDKKARVIQSLQAQGKTVMVGDGINDAPALTVADVGVAPGAGTELAMDCADVILMKNSLSDAVFAVRLSRTAFRIMKQNLFWALIYNLSAIPVAAGCFARYGITLTPGLSAAAMSLSSIFVVFNALRINRLKRQKKTDARLADSASDVEQNRTDKECSDMITTVIKVEGMMCPHCEKHVNEAIAEAFDVEKVTSDFQKGETVIVSKDALNTDEIKKVITQAGYTMLS